MPLSLKRKVFELLDPNEGGTKYDRIVNSFIVILILFNTTAVILETLDDFYKQWKTFFTLFEYISIFIFTIEYILRVWACTENQNYVHPVRGRINYIFSAGAIIDLLAILPFYVPLFTHIDLRFLRTLRLLRFFRFFKLGRYMKASALIKRVFKSKKEELVLSFVITLFLIIIASCVMYYIEHDSQPDKFSSIPETMWWSVATLTTVGYGDVYPITIAGKTLTALISIMGIGLFALPAGILASGFSDEFKHLKKNKKTCEYCGSELHT